MQINVDRTPPRKERAAEGDIYVDSDGDVHIVLAAANLADIRDEELVVCCLRDDAAWVRGRASAVQLDAMTRLSAGDSVTLTVG